MYQGRDPRNVGFYVSVNPIDQARSVTTDWEYTVPQNPSRFAVVESVFCAVRNNSATALNNGALSYVEMQLRNNANTVRLVASYMPLGVASGYNAQVLSGPLYLAPGDRIRGVTSSANTAAGSDVTVQTAAKLTELLP